MSLARALAQRWGATLDGRELRGSIDGAAFRARVTESALVDVRLDCVDVSGFAIEIAPRGDPDAALEWASLAEYVGYRAARGPDGVREAFLRRFEVTGTDRGLLRVWLDDLAREALLAAPERYSLARGELTVAPFAAIGLDGFERTVRAAVRLVSRPHRLAAAWRDVLAPIAPADVPDAWLADGVEITVHAATELRLDTPWRADAPDGDKLRTRLRAERLRVGDDVAIWRSRLDDADRPAPAPTTRFGDRHDAHGPVEQLAPLAARITAASPDVLAASAGHVVLWWRGLIQDPRRLAAATELVSALAISPTGPYR